MIFVNVEFIEYLIILCFKNNNIVVFLAIENKQVINFNRLVKIYIIIILITLNLRNLIGFTIENSVALFII